MSSVKTFRGSRIRYGKIIFSRRYHPPDRSKKSNNPTFAGEWNNDTKLITIFLAGLKKAGYNSDNERTHNEITRIIIHEVLHGVIDYILDSDFNHPKKMNIHWPHDNGMEYSSPIE